MGMVTSISWKGDLIVIGDSDGNLSLWDTKTKKYKVRRPWISCEITDATF